MDFDRSAQQAIIDLLHREDVEGHRGVGLAYHSAFIEDIDSQIVLVFIHIYRFAGGNATRDLCRRAEVDARR
jgi:hypothetical protein